MVLGFEAFRREIPGGTHGFAHDVVGFAAGRDPVNDDVPHLPSESVQLGLCARRRRVECLDSRRQLGGFCEQPHPFFTLGTRDVLADRLLLRAGRLEVGEHVLWADFFQEARAPQQ